MRNPKKITVVLVKSESGDDYGPYLFSSKPTDKYLEEFLRKECPDEFCCEGDCGPGTWGSYLHVSIKSAAINVLKDKP